VRLLAGISADEVAATPIKLGVISLVLLMSVDGLGPAVDNANGAVEIAMQSSTAFRGEVSKLESTVKRVHRAR
jgi:hypothetical protein